MDKLIRKILSVFPKWIQDFYDKHESVLLYLIVGAMTTVISIVAGVVVLHEAFTLPQVIGAALILVSVYIASVTGQSQQKSKSE